MMEISKRTLHTYWSGLFFDVLKLLKEKDAQHHRLLIGEMGVHKVLLTAGLGLNRCDGVTFWKYRACMVEKALLLQDSTFGYVPVSWPYWRKVYWRMVVNPFEIHVTIQTIAAEHGTYVKIPKFYFWNCHVRNAQCGTRIQLSFSSVSRKGLWSHQERCQPQGPPWELQPHGALGFWGRLTADMVGASHRLGMIHPSSGASTSMWQTSPMPGMLNKSILRDTRQAEMEKINNISKSPLFADKHW